MKTQAIPYSWIERSGLRLDCGPYTSGAFEGRIRLELLDGQTSRLSDLTRGGLSGIMNAGRIKRMWVNDPAHGVPFLSSTDILKADLSNLSLISKRAVRDNPKLIIRKGWTLITRAGTVGRMAYARPDMDGMACTEDVLRVIPDETLIPPGYLYAFLSSRFGLPLVTSGTYGAIIQHIEPEHVASLPVPRLGDFIEKTVHELVEEGASLRTKASAVLRNAIHGVAEYLMAPAIPCPERNVQVIASRDLERSMRFEAFFHNPWAHNVEKWAVTHSKGYWRLADVAHVYDVPPFKHIYVDADQGLPFYTSGDLFHLERFPEKHLSRTRTRDLYKYVLERGWVLLARSGQLGGIIGRPQFADSALDNTTTSDHVIRIVPEKSSVTSGYLYAYLATPEVGYPLLTRTMTGASVPALWPVYLEDIPVVKASDEFMMMIDEDVQNAFEMRVTASQMENSARGFVEHAIEEAT